MLFCEKFAVSSMASIPYDHTHIKNEPFHWSRYYNLNKECQHECHSTNTAMFLMIVIVIR